MQKLLEYAKRWLQPLNEMKTKFVVHHTTIQTPKLKVEYNGVKIVQQRCFKYLDYHIDSKLSFRDTTRHNWPRHGRRTRYSNSSIHNSQWLDDWRKDSSWPTSGPTSSQWHRSSSSSRRQDVKTSQDITGDVWGSSTASFNVRTLSFISISKSLTSTNDSER